MKLFLGAIVVLFVSGEDTTIIEGFLNESVHLPCNCSGRILSKGFQWHNETNEDVVNAMLFQNDKNGPKNYNERVSLSFLDESSKCDILLTNITVGDSGIYRCSFQRPGYTKNFVNLTVSARYTICKKQVSEKVFQCDVEGRYRDAEIQWRLDGNLLQTSTTDNITYGYSWDASADLHRFHSKFITDRNLTETPSCHVETKNILVNVSETCKLDMNPIKGIPENSWKCLVLIPIALVLGIFIYRRFRFSRKRQGQTLYRIAENEGDSMSALTG